MGYDGFAHISTEYATRIWKVLTDINLDLRGTKHNPRVFVRTFETFPSYLRTLEITLSVHLEILEL